MDNSVAQVADAVSRAWGISCDALASANDLRHESRKLLVGELNKKQLFARGHQLRKPASRM